MGIFLSPKEIAIYLLLAFGISLSMPFFYSIRKKDKEGGKCNTVVCRNIDREILGIPCDRSGATMEERDD
jgi:hypothetical protein